MTGKLLSTVIFTLVVLFLGVGSTLFYRSQIKPLRGIEVTYTRGGSILDALSLLRRYKEYANLWDVNRCDEAWDQYVGSGAKARQEQQIKDRQATFERLAESTTRDLEGFAQCKREVETVLRPIPPSFDEPPERFSAYLARNRAYEALQRSCDEKWPDFSLLSREFGIDYHGLWNTSSQGRVETARRELSALDPFVTSGFKVACERNIEPQARIASMVVGKDRADISRAAEVKEGGGKVEVRRNMTWLKEKDGKWYRDW